MPHTGKGENVCLCMVVANLAGDVGITLASSNSWFLLYLPDQSSGTKLDL